jgi:hypothetical protein
MLTHEDGGMMGQFLVLDTVASIQDPPTPAALELFPNPILIGQHLTFHFDGHRDIQRVEILDATGRRVYDNRIVGVSNEATTLEIEERTFVPGFYLVRITSAGGNACAPLMISR